MLVVMRWDGWFDNQEIVAVLLDVPMGNYLVSEYRNFMKWAVIVVFHHIVIEARLS